MSLQRKLMSFVDSLSPSGDSRYMSGIMKAVELLENQNKSTRHSVRAVFLVSGAESHQGRKYIADRVYAELAVRYMQAVKFITFNIDGTLQVRDLMMALATQTGGIAIDIKAEKILDSDVMSGILYEQLRPYYSHMASESVTEPVLSMPHFDDQSKEVMLTMSLPAFVRGRFIGVVSLDTNIAEYGLRDVLPNAYVYVIRMDDGAVVYHPMLHLPTDADDELRTTYIHELEREAEENGVHASMMSGGQGSKHFLSTLYRCFGHPYLDGVETNVENMTYTWRPIERTEFSICIVTKEHADDDVTEIKRKKPGPIHYTYHKSFTDAKMNVTICRYFGRVATFDHSIVRFSNRAFNDTYGYLSSIETPERIKSYSEALFKGDSDSIFKEGVLDSVRVTSPLDVSWHLARREQKAVWTYLVVPGKILRNYPGVVADTLNSLQFRPWYHMAAGMPGNIIVQRPGEDAAGAGHIITIAQAIHVPVRRSGKPSSDEKIIYAVLAVDVTVEYFYAKMIGSYSPCAQVQGISCILLDSTGYVISHYGTVEPVRRKTDHPIVENIHITKLEGFIANDMIKRGFMNKTSCIGIQHRTEFVTYKMTEGLSVVYSDSDEDAIGYNIIHIKTTNVYILVKNNKAEQGKNPCVCSFWASFTASVCLEKPTSECECPCYRYRTFHHCTNTFEGMLNQNWTQCTNFAENIDATSISGKEKDYRDTLDDCTKPSCHHRRNKQRCHLWVGCRWCEVDEKGHDLDTAFCGKRSDCYFGMVGHPGPYSGVEEEDEYAPIQFVVYSMIVFFCLIIATTIFYKSNINIYIRRRVNEGDAQRRNIITMKKPPSVHELNRMSYFLDDPTTKSFSAKSEATSSLASGGKRSSGRRQRLYRSSLTRIRQELSTDSSRVSTSRRPMLDKRHTSEETSERGSTDGTSYPSIDTVGSRRHARRNTVYRQKERT